MKKIKIKNFGPIKIGYFGNDGWLEINKLTLFIGNQGSGKSTIAKLISTFTWLEKALTRGDFQIKELERKDVLRRYLRYHKIDSYLNYGIGNTLEDKAEISYVGDAYSFHYKARRMTIKAVSERNYFLPQIMYVPADRNFLSSIEDRKSQRIVSDALRELLDEMDKAQRELKEELTIPINDIRLKYDKGADILYVKGDHYMIDLSQASSGIQSLVPLYLVTRYLTGIVNNQGEQAAPMNNDELERFRKGVSEIYNNPDLTVDQRRVAISALSAKFNKTALINIVEELEQNLFPSSQWNVLKSLLGYNNSNPQNQLVLTTHSPYVINYLSIAIEAWNLKAKIEKSADAKRLLKKLAQIIPVTAVVNPTEVFIYQLNERDGSICRLGDFEGIPSDKNFLNLMLREGNQLFDALLALEEEL